MKKGTRIALILGAIPFITMVFALPFVNRIEPIILGLPFLLFWLLAWVVLTPFILALAFLPDPLSGIGSNQVDPAGPLPPL